MGSPWDRSSVLTANKRLELFIMTCLQWLSYIDKEEVGNSQVIIVSVLNVHLIASKSRCLI